MVAKGTTPLFVNQFPWEPELYSKQRLGETPSWPSGEFQSKTDMLTRTSYEKLDPKLQNSGANSQ